jgi:hypothetical protein
MSISQPSNTSVHTQPDHTEVIVTTRQYRSGYPNQGVEDNNYHKKAIGGGGTGGTHPFLFAKSLKFTEKVF